MIIGQNTHFVTSPTGQGLRPSIGLPWFQTVSRTRPLRSSQSTTLGARRLRRHTSGWVEALIPPVTPPTGQGLKPSTRLPWSPSNRYCPHLAIVWRRYGVLSDFPGGHPSWDYSHWSTLNFGVPTNPLAKRSEKASVFIEGNLFPFKPFLHHSGDVGFDTR